MKALDRSENSVKRQSELQSGDVSANCPHRFDCIDGRSGSVLLSFGEENFLRIGLLVENWKPKQNAGSRDLKSNACVVVF